jgi:hypothetical protein
LAAPRRLGSITTKVDRAGHIVHLLGNSQTFFDVFELVLPANSVMMGRVNGSQLAKMVPALIFGQA